MTLLAETALAGLFTAAVSIAAAVVTLFSEKAAPV